MVPEPPEFDHEIVYVDPRRGRGTGKAALVCAVVLGAGVVAVGLSFAIGSSGNIEDFAWAFTNHVLPALVAVVVVVLIGTIVLAIISIARSHSTLRRMPIIALALAAVSALAYLAWISVLGSLLADYVPA